MSALDEILKDSAYAYLHRRIDELERKLAAMKADKAALREARMEKIKQLDYEAIRDSAHRGYRKWLRTGVMGQTVSDWDDPNWHIIKEAVAAVLAAIDAAEEVRNG